MPDKSSVKTAVFYGISSEFLSVALKIIEKLYENKENTLFLCRDESEIKEYDAKLWTYSKTSFIPHCSANTIKEGMIEFCHTWISEDIEFPNNPVCLIHNGLDVNDPKIEAFTKIVDIFDISLIEVAKKRASFYASLGFNEQKFWEQNGATWTSKVPLA